MCKSVAIRKFHKHGSLCNNVILFERVQMVLWECSGSVVECFTRDQSVESLSLTGVVALCP